MTNTNRPPFRGPALFSYGFRPFFLAASVFAIAAIVIWMLVLDGSLTIAGPFTPTDWHVHEMLFGYASAVIAGFLFTAIPNWTGRMPKRGWPLAILVALWIAGRLACAGLFGAGAVVVMLIDAGFLAAIVAMVVVEIVAGRNWRNLMVVVPVLLLFGANLLFHVEALNQGSADIGRRLGLAVVIFLITLIGGRIIPSFTRNWLVKRDPAHLPAPASRFDAVCLVAGAIALLTWSFHPEGPAAGAVLLIAAVLHLTRLSRWQGARTGPSPLLLMLHVAYGFVPFGLAADAAASVGLLPVAVGVHLLGIGAIGGMTIAVMMRASLGHTGNALVAGPVLTAAAAMVFLAALIRVCFPDISFAGLTGLWIAALLWAAGFALFLVRIGPYLARTSRKPT
ncbi:NnrS family protein [Labrenzia sp. 011]|uniref:NnrS family protein n=1 Tax=Labrenzia sp. 011 TaxID=2171494 RepID=UPI000D50DC60|nr:NnrS family protein [Labrenzia sp. 011]PVB61498.1 short-chain dehydrogenase [Labrenzia sp. 011]